MADLLEINEDGQLKLNLHQGQLSAWNSEKRFILVLAGTQGGKTSFGPVWLWREIQKRGPGDYLVVAPTYPLLELKALPEFLKLFDRYLKLGNYIGAPRHQFVFSREGSMATFGSYDEHNPTRILFGHAQNPESLESATAKAAWLDEAGQDRFRLGSWEAILRRQSIAMGRILITTTPYNFGWLKRQLFDPWKRADENHPYIEVVRFESIFNPMFPIEEFERARATMPKWKFDMMYRALFTKPAGLIYDSFNEETHKIDPFTIPDSWPRYGGVDFGGVNTAAVFFAAEPETNNLYLYRTYKAGSRTAATHAKYILEGEPNSVRFYGGAPSEDQWRSEFTSAGLTILPPLIKDVEVGIDRVYGAHKRGELYVFSNLEEYLEEKLTYSRELDEDGEPTERIANKNTYHLMDAERYIIGGWLRRASPDIKLPPASFSYVGANKQGKQFELPFMFRN